MSVKVYRKICKEFKILSNKLSVEEVLIQGAVETGIQIFFFGKGLFDIYDSLDEVLGGFLFVERRRPGLEEVNYVVQLITS